MKVNFATKSLNKRLLGLYCDICSLVLSRERYCTPKVVKYHFPELHSISQTH